MPIVVSYNDLGLLGGLAVQAGQAQGQIADKNYYRQRQMRDESMLLQDSLNKPGGMPAAQFGVQPAPRPGGIAGTIMGAASGQPQARIVQKTPAPPVGGSANLGEQELAKNLAKETAKIEADKQELRARQDEITQMVDSGVINQQRGNELIKSFMDQRYGIKSGGGDKGSVSPDLKPANADEQAGWAIAMTGRWDQIDNIKNQNKAAGYRSTRSAGAKNVGLWAGIQKQIESLSNQDFMALWAKNDYPPEVYSLINQEYEKRFNPNTAGLSENQFNDNAPWIQPPQEGGAASPLKSLNDQEILKAYMDKAMQSRQ